MLQVFGFSGAVEGFREEWPHLKRGEGVSCISLEAYAATSRDVMKIHLTKI